MFFCSIVGVLCCPGLSFLFGLSVRDGRLVVTAESTVEEGDIAGFIEFCVLTHVNKLGLSRLFFQFGNYFGFPFI